MRRSRPRQTAKNRSTAGILDMELAGLEPATSWVRSRRPPALSLACLQGFRGGRGPAEAPRFRLGSAHLGSDRAKERALWPDLAAVPSRSGEQRATSRTVGWSAPSKAEECDINCGTGAAARADRSHGSARHARRPLGP